MATITTRAGKGSPLTNTEVDDNFSNLNSAKYESGASPTFANSALINSATTVSFTLDGASANSKNIYFKGDSSAQMGRIASIGTSLYFQLTDATNYFTINPGSTVINDSSVDHDFRVESNDYTHALFVDAGANHVNINGSTDFGGALNVNGGLNSKQAVFTSTNNRGLALSTATRGGQNDGVAIIDAQDTESTGGRLELHTMGVARASFERDQIVFNDGSNDQDFRVESNSNANMLFVDAGNDAVGIGGAPISTAPLTVVGQYEESSGNGYDYNVALYPDTALSIAQGKGTGILFMSEDSGSSARHAAHIQSARASTVASNYTNDLVFSTRNNGSEMANVFKLQGDRNAVFFDMTLDAALGAKAVQITANNSSGTGPELLVHNPGQGSSAQSIITFGGKTSGTEGYTGSIHTTNNDGLFFGAANASSGFGSQPSSFLQIAPSGSVKHTPPDAAEFVVNDSSSDSDFRVESNDNTHMLFVDGGANHVNIGTPTDYGSTFNVGGNTALNRGTNGAITASGATLSIQGTGAYNSNYFGSSLATVAIRSNEPANNGWNPTLNITTIRQSLVTNKDSNGGIGFSTIDDSNNTGIDDAARITIFNENSASNTSPTAIRFYNNVGGSKTQASQAALDLFSTGAVFNNDSNDMDFRVESDGNANMLFVDGGNNRVGIGTTDVSSQGTLAVNGSAILGRTSTTTGDFFSSGGGNSGAYNGIAILSNSDAINAQSNTSLSSWIVDVGGRAADGLTFPVNTADSFGVRRVAAGGTYYGAANYFQISGGSTVINEDGNDHDFRVESDGNANMLFVDGGSNTVNVGTSNAGYNGKFNVASGTTTTAASFESALGGAGAACHIFMGVSTRANNGLQLSSIGSGAVILGGSLAAAIYNTEAAQLALGGNNVYNQLILSSSEIVINDGSSNTDFRVESDGNANMLRVDAGGNRVLIGAASPNASNPNASLQVGGNLTFQNYDVNSNVTTDTGISINQGSNGMAMQVLASNHSSVGTSTKAGQYFLKFYYSGNNAPAVTLVAGDDLVTFGVSGSNTLTITMPAGGNSISFITSG